MKPRSLFAAVMCLLVLPVWGQGKLDPRRSLGKPYTFRNLTILPVSDATARPTNGFLTLDEGLRARTVRVQEAQDGGDVNTLYISNSGTKPLYLMGGEVVLGGQQDRVLAQDRIIPGGKKKVPITVFCVEHGRWSGRADFGESAKTVASAAIRLNAQNGEFSGYNAVAAERATLSRPGTPAMAGGNMSGRILGRGVARASSRVSQAPADASVAVSSRVGKAQQEVWDKVAQKNARLGTQNASDSYGAALNMSGGKAKSSVPAYIQALSKSVGNDPHVVGVVACINGKVVAIDTFGDPALFRKLWPKLLRSYAADAVEAAPNAKGKKVVLNAGDVQAFYATATDGRRKTENRTDTSAMLRMDSKQATTFRLHTPSKAGGAAGGAASPIHESVLGK